MGASEQRGPLTWALVTGGSRGIGAAIGVRLAAEGYGVILNYRSRDEEAEAVRARIVAAGGVAELSRFDVADPEASGAAIEALLASGREIGVVVNNAGIVRDVIFPEMELSDWQRVTRTTLDGFFNVTRPLVWPMIHRKKGRIINISSVSGVIGNRGQVNYGAAKAGLIGATRALAQELAKRKITVNAVAPGPVKTEMLEGAPMEHILRAIPMRRVATAEEVAGVVAYLCREEAGYITGQVIGINGGLA